MIDVLLRQQLENVLEPEANKFIAYANSDQCSGDFSNLKKLHHKMVWKLIFWACRTENYNNLTVSQLSNFVSDYISENISYQL